MNLSILIISLAFLLTDPQTPNYYPGYSSAREASKKSGKELLIFFTEKSCNNCEAAWIAFSKDPVATQQFVSTRMDIEDFDGGVFFKMLDLDQTPTWVVFAPDGIERERWSGGWKDAQGNPTAFDKSVVITANPQIKAAPAQSKSSSSIPPQNKTISALNNPKVENATTEKNPSAFILQAGYFGSEANAQKMVTDLKNKGYHSYTIKQAKQNGAVFFRVISGMFNSEADANEEQQKLMTAGFKASIKKLSDI